MAAHDTNLPITSTDPRTPRHSAVTRTGRDGARDTATVIVWRTAPDDAHVTAHSDALDSPLVPRQIHRLVAIYSDVHSTVLDFDADDTLRHAAEAAGRRHLAFTGRADLARSPEPPRRVTLVVLRWPRPDISSPGQDAPSLFGACERHLADDGSTVVVVTAAAAGLAGTSYGEHEQVLLPAGQAAGPASPARDRAAAGCRRPRHFHLRDGPRHDGLRPRQRRRYLATETSATLMIFGHPDRRP